MRQQRIITTILLTTLLSSCNITPPKQAATTPEIAHLVDHSILNNARQLAYTQPPLSNRVVNALAPDISVAVPKHANRSHYFDIAANNAPAAAFFTSLAKDAHYNIIISPEVKGNITLDLKHVTMQQVMDAIENIYGYQYEQTSYGYNVYPARLETQTFHVSYLNINRTGTSETSISSGQITSNTNSSSSGNSQSTSTANETVKASTVKTETINNFWGELTNTLNAIVGITNQNNNTTEANNPPASTTTNPIAAVANTLSQTRSQTARRNTTNNRNNTPAATTNASAAATTDGRVVIINPQAGLVVVKAYPAQLRQVAQYLKQVQTIMNRQVIIDAKILEVTLKAGYQSGIDWRLLGIQQMGSELLDDTLQPFSNIFKIKATADHGFESLITLMQSQGRINVISSPRIATINNQKALIKVGIDRFYITNVSTTTDTTTVGSQVIGEDVEMTPFFSGVALDVIPEIDKHGEITLHLHPIISTVTETDLKFTLNNQNSSLPSAQSAIRESDNIVRVKNNQIVVIGGLMVDNNDYQKGHIPFMSRIPGLGWFFDNHQNSSKKQEIVILLRPTLLNRQSIRKQLEQVSARYKKLDQEFSFQTKIYHPHQQQSRRRQERR
ncbi:MAG: pilus (MSHA type) biogenesis protein MshL [Gammaproteobacteria bacterium]|nr:pilus (MSHA type) biogenesis protein MshL [Gammaproteobacteria bacterium]